MHELSIAQSIIEIAEDALKNETAESIKSIDIEIGALSGVIIEALEFAMESVVKNTKLKNAEINYVKVEGKAQCLECNLTFKMNDLLSLCPDCNKARYEIKDGKQLRIKSLTI